MKLSYQKIETALGHTFQNRVWLVEALTHSSYVNERKHAVSRNNERLEFLGDVVLSMVVSEHLFQYHPDLPEGELTKIRAMVVCEETLSACAKKIQLGSFLILGRGELATGGQERPSILADAFEAVIAALYLDGGYETAQRFVIEQLTPWIHQAVSGELIQDYKTYLQEYIQTQKDQQLSYVLERTEGPDHNKIFYMHVTLNEVIIGRGHGHSKKEAEQNAARQGITTMKENSRMKKGYCVSQEN